MFIRMDNQLISIEQNFYHELLKAGSGIKTSLPFITNQLPSSPLVSKNEQFQVMGIGGSTFQNGTAIKKNDKIELSILEEKQIHFQSGEAFLSLIGNALVESTKVLSINFAYPLVPIFENEKLDGKLIANSKENDFGFLIGKKIGFEIESYILKKRNKKVKVSVANDTVCLLLSGLTQFPGGKIACGIVGTGVNFAYFLDRTHAVNLESANFDKFSQSEEGKRIDRNSALPRRALFEKETSGAYLYQHFNLYVKSRGVSFPSISETKDLSDLSIKNVPKVSEFAKSFLQKSAGLVATQVAGITRLKKQNMVFIMQGSVFWNGYRYKQWVEEYVKLLIPQYTVSFVFIENSPLLGAAKLVCV